MDMTMQNMKAGFMHGHVILLNFAQLDAPSSEDASSSSVGTDFNAARLTNIFPPAPHQIDIKAKLGIAQSGLPNH